MNAFGRHCLHPTKRYLMWHGEDGYGLRGDRAQARLERQISGKNVKPHRKSSFSCSGAAWQPHVALRLPLYKKNLTSLLNCVCASRCDCRGTPAGLWDHKDRFFGGPQAPGAHVPATRTCAAAAARVRQVCRRGAAPEEVVDGAVRGGGVAGHVGELRVP